MLAGDALPCPPSGISDNLRADIKLALMLAALLLCARLAYQASLVGSSLAIFSIEPALIIFASLGATSVLVERGHERLAALAACVAVYGIGRPAMGFCATICFYSGRLFPMQDDQLYRFDQILGFDWLAYLRFVDAHAWINDYLLHPAYRSIECQTAAITVLLVASGRTARPLVLLLAMTIGLLLCSIIAALVPAYGAYSFLHLSASAHPHITFLETGDGTAALMDWLRAGMPDGPVPDSRGGMISFPSFHTVAAVLLSWAAWELRAVRSPVVLLNTLLLAATPLHGSHYLMDMLAGAAVAALVLLLLLYLFKHRIAAPMQSSSTTSV